MAHNRNLGSMVRQVGFNFKMYMHTLYTMVLYTPFFKGGTYLIISLYIIKKFTKNILITYPIFKVSLSPISIYGLYLDLPRVCNISAQIHPNKTHQQNRKFLHLYGRSRYHHPYHLLKTNKSRHRSGWDRASV